jgi:hypothetical protein
MKKNATAKTIATTVRQFSLTHAPILWNALLSQL